MRVLVFGDSITQGYWAVDGGWVDRVRQFYDARQFQDLKGRDEPTVFNLGISADNTDDILNRIKNEVLARTRPTHEIKPVVMLQIGANDSSMSPIKPQISIDQYRKNLTEIIKIVNPLASKIILIGLSSCDEEKTNPVNWGDHVYLNNRIKKYEEVMSEVAKQEKINIIPIFNEFKKKQDSGDNLLPDGIHPNDKGHQVIFEIVIARLKGLLR